MIGARGAERAALVTTSVALLVFVAGRCLVPMDETDLFFNLRLGEIVLEAGRVPTTNLLSFTHPDARDVNLAWIFQVLLALVHRAGGVPATVLLKTAFVLATWALLWAVARRRGAAPAATALALALAAWAAEPRFVERPHLVTFLGLAALLLALARAEAGRPRLLAALVPLGLVWANANSCLFLAPAILALYAAGARLEGDRAAARRAGLVAALLVPILFATPSGAGWIPYVANHFRMPTLRLLQEYRAAEWPLDGPFFFVAGGAGLLALLPRVLPAMRPAALPLRHLLPIAALGALGAVRIRFVAEFALLAGPALAAGLTRIAPALARAPAGAAAAALLVALALAPRIAAGRPYLDLGPERDLVPSDAIAFVERHRLHEDERLYHDMEVGSYLTWRWGPAPRVFQDPRINGYPEAFHATLRRRDLSRGEWERFLAGFGVTAALVSYPTESPRAALFDPARWALVYRAADGLVFVRRGDAARTGLVAALELPVTFTYDPERGAEARALAAPPAGSPVPACEWHRRRGDHLVAIGDDAAARGAYEAALAAPGADGGCLAPPLRDRARAALGAAQLRLGAPAAARAALAGLRDAPSRTNEAFAALALGEVAGALAAFDRLVAEDAANAEAQLGRGLALAALGRRGEARAAFEAVRARFPGSLAAATAAARLRSARGE